MEHLKIFDGNWIDLVIYFGGLVFMGVALYKGLKIKIEVLQADLARLRDNELHELKRMILTCQNHKDKIIRTMDRRIDEHDTRLAVVEKTISCKGGKP